LKTQIGNDINRAIQLLNEGELISIPTETVYGLAANGLNSSAVAKIYEAKKRPSFNPLILHFSSFEQVRPYLSLIPDYLETLVQKFSPGPLTYIVKKPISIPDITTSGLDTFAFRIPNHPLTLELLSALNFPLAAPSANIFGMTSPTNYTHVFDQLNGRIPYILDGGACVIGLESTILDCTSTRPIIRRFGGVSKEDIEEVLSMEVIVESYGSKSLAPGMLAAHYSPGIPLELLSEEEWIQFIPNENCALLSLSRIHPLQRNHSSIQLSKTRNMNEAAAKLFESLRFFKSNNCERIIAHTMPERGIGLAINDRLKRASATRF